MNICLNGEWDLYYALETKDTRENLDWLRTHGDRIKARVPGNIELDLYRAGIEPDPFFGQNIYRFRKYEFYCWQFERDIYISECKSHQNYELVLNGINCFADIYINDEWVGSADNAFIQHRFSTKGYLLPGQNNHISVRIKSAINVGRRMSVPTAVRPWEFGDYAMFRIPASSFGWDIMGRFVSAGMWRDVMLVPVSEERIIETYYATKRVNSNSADMIVYYRWVTDAPIIEGYSIKLEGECEGHTFHIEKKIGFFYGFIEFSVEDAQLWWPKGYGKANLYTVTFSLLKDGIIIDSKTERIGIRKYDIMHKLLPGDDGEFKVLVNGCPIMCKGSNWVPLDALHSRDSERLKPVHDLFDDLGCNIIRCWGGNVYEDDSFFDLCDERGMMVWQDFGLACAVYSQEDDYCKQIEKEAISVVRKLRNHASILLWAGDNEVDACLTSLGFPTEENRYNKLTREVFPNVIRMYDPYRVFLPSSPYIPNGMQENQVPEQHNWGARAYFKDDFYKHSSAHFISECGYHGCPSVKSLEKFISKDGLKHRLGNDEWDTHNTDYITYTHRSYNRIELMEKQVRILFGFVPDDLDLFSRLSQISQAEAKKFFIERTRIKKWRRTGIIWWNTIDGWPQISDAVVDYYYDKKLAYYYIKRVQRPIAVMMDELVNWGHKVIIGNDSRDTVTVRYCVQDGDTMDILMSGTVVSPANENICVGYIPEMAGEQKLYLLTWTVDDRKFGNHYISGYPSYDATKMLKWIDKIEQLPDEFDW